MSVTTISTGNTLTLRIIGTLNSTIQKEFKAAYKDEIGKKSEIIVDLAQTEFADSSGLGLLLILHGNSLGSTNKPKLSIINARPNIKEILQICRFDQYYTIH